MNFPCPGFHLQHQATQREKKKRLGHLRTCQLKILKLNSICSFCELIAWAVGNSRNKVLQTRGNPGMTQQWVSTARQDIQQILFVSTRFSNARQRVRKSAHSSQIFSGYHVQKCAYQICVHRKQHFYLIIPEMETQQKCICTIKTGIDHVIKFKNNNNKI